MLSNKLPGKMGHIVVTLLCAFLSLHVQANQDMARLVYAPHHLNSNTPTLLPTGLSPNQIKLAYGFSNVSFQGEGQVIAITSAYDAPTVEADLAVFNATYGLPACTTANGCFQKIYASGGQPNPDVNWSLESTLDVQWAHAMAPKAKILLVEGGDNSFGGLYTAVYVAIQHGASVISMSWGSSEFSNESGFDPIFSVAGPTFVAASGDAGTGNLYPAVSPYVIAVGGTTLSVDANGNYISEKAWSGSGGGLSQYETAPAYQLNFPIPNNPNKLRGIPDVSFNADPATGFAVYSSYGYGGWLVVGGTSAATPQWAALIAIIKSGSNKNLQGLNSLLYTAAKQNYQLTYNDITTGSNGSCGYYCNAQTGYDYVSGLGTPRVQYLTYEVILNGLRS